MRRLIEIARQSVGDGEEEDGRWRKSHLRWRWALASWSGRKTSNRGVRGWSSPWASNTSYSWRGGASSRQQICWTKNEPFGGGNHFAPEERHKAKGRLPFRGRAILFSQHSFSLCAAGRRWKACRPKWWIDEGSTTWHSIGSYTTAPSAKRPSSSACCPFRPRNIKSPDDSSTIQVWLFLSFFLLVCLCLESLPEPILSNCVTSSPPRHCINLPPPTRLGLFVPQGQIGWWWRRKKKLNISYTPSKIHHLRQNGGLLNPTATPFLSFHPTGREKKSFKDGKKKKGHLFRPFEKWIDNPLFAQHDKIKSGARVCV